MTGKRIYMSKSNEQETGPKLKGLVISYFGNSVAVEASGGQVFQCHLRKNQALPVVGDEVEWTLQGDGTGIIVGIVPRRSVLARGDARGNLKPIAANVDVMVVVMSPPPSLSEHLIDRYLIAAEVLNIMPVIVMNKVDLLSDQAREEAMARLKMYADIPYQIIVTSVLTKEGLPELLAILKDKLAVLVGPSGVGKSSIISALTGDMIRVTEVSAKGAGKHTTTATSLYHIPGGGGLIDSPGVRDFSLWSVGKEAIFDSFKEFKPFLTGCRFRDCQHLVEPGCALREAVAEGKVHPKRFDNYLKLMNESEDERFKK